MKKSGLFTVIAFSLFVVACKHTGISENEKKGVKEVVSLYGGKIKYSTGDTAATDSSAVKNYFELELSKSKFVEEYAATPELPASGIAYAFYKKLGNDKQKYTHIKSDLVLNNGQKVEYEYPVNQLEMVSSNIKLAQKIADLIKQGNFEALKPLLDDSSYAKYNKDEFIANLKEADAQFEKVNELVIVGFRFYKLFGKDILHISGQMMRGAKANAFSIDMDPNDQQGRAIMIHYSV